MSLAAHHIEDIVATAPDVVARAMDAFAAPGLAAAIVHGNRVVWSGVFGLADVGRPTPVSRTTTFRIASITKTFVGIAVLQLWEGGLLGLDDPVGEHLTSVWIQQPRGTRPITVRDLLLHRSGIGETRRRRNLVPPRATADLAVPEGAAIAALPQYYARGLRSEVGPGRKWAYANHGYGVLGQLVEDVTGTPLNVRLRTHILEPLGMDATDLHRVAKVTPTLATGYAMGRRGLKPVKSLDFVVPAAGGMFSNLDDMTRYAMALLGRGTNAHGTICKPETLELMWESHWCPGIGIFDMGLAFMRDDLAGHRVVHHGGGWPGFISMMRLAPDDDLAVLAFTNGSNPSANVVADDLLRMLLDQPARGEVMRRRPAPSQPALWSQFCGTYRPAPGIATNTRAMTSFGGEVEVAVIAGQLQVRSLLGPLRGWQPLRAKDRDDPWLLGAVTGDGPKTSEHLFRFEADGGQAHTVQARLGLPFTLTRVRPQQSLRRVVPSAAAVVAATAGSTIVTARRRARARGMDRM